MPAQWRARLKPLLRDAGEWWILPGLAIFLPWSWCFRIYRWCCARPFLFREKVAGALAQLPTPLSPAEADEWAARHRMVLLVDRADAFLSRFRGDRWLDRHVRRVGDPWPNEPFIGITFHFGAGLWSLRDISRHGRRVSFVSIRFERFYKAARISHYGALWRMREVARAGKAAVIYTGGGRESIRSALHGGTSVISLIDVPAALTKQVAEQRFLGAAAWFPPGMLLLAKEADVPVMAFVMGIDPLSGTRELIVRRIHSHDSGQQLSEIIGFLEGEIERHPHAWHNWPELWAFRETPGAECQVSFSNVKTSKEPSAKDSPASSTG